MLKMGGNSKTSGSPMVVLNVVEAADRLRVSTRTTYDLLRRGRLRGRKAGRSWRVTENALADFLEKPSKEREEG